MILHGSGWSFRISDPLVQSSYWYPGQALNLWHRSPEVSDQSMAFLCQLWLHFVTCPKSCPPLLKFFVTWYSLFLKPCPLPMPLLILPPVGPFCWWIDGHFAAGRCFLALCPGDGGADAAFFSAQFPREVVWWTVRVVHHKDVMQRKPGWFRG